VQKTLLGAMCLTLAASIWGGMYVVSKYVLQFISPFPLLLMRYIIGVTVLGAVLWASFRRGRRISGTSGSFAGERLPWWHWRTWGLFAWVGFIGYFVSVGAQFVGTKLADAHTGALITAASPAFIFVFARLILGERLTSRKVFSLLLSTAGVFIVIGWPSEGKVSLLGDLFLLLAAVTWALLSVYAKLASSRHSSLSVTTFALAFAILFTAPVAAESWDPAQLHALSRPLVFWGVVYLGVVSTAVAFFLWNKGLELMEAGAGSLFFFFQPVVGAIFGWLLLGETLSWNFFVGGLFIVLGVGLAVLQGEDHSVPASNSVENL
jgi:drug/metabolite transporter (DMT)-like permease